MKFLHEKNNDFAVCKNLSKCRSENNIIKITM